jgi:hypothetical protein
MYLWGEDHVTLIRSKLMHFYFMLWPRKNCKCLRFSRCGRWVSDPFWNWAVSKEDLTVDWMLSCICVKSIAFYRMRISHYFNYLLFYNSISNIVHILWYCMKEIWCTICLLMTIFFVALGSGMQQISLPPSRNALPDVCNLQSYEDWKRSILEDCDNVEP